jgi:sulfur-oxidizing protein SoxY
MFTRRTALALGAGGVAVAALPTAVLASTPVEAAMAAFTGGASVGMGGITLTSPEIAENGNNVPVSVSAPGAVAIAMFATRNPFPQLCVFRFGEGAAEATAATRIRLGETQEVVAIAQLADGSFVQASSEVKVTIGGCGG